MWRASEKMPEVTKKLLKPLPYEVWDSTHPRYQEVVSRYRLNLTLGSRCLGCGTECISEHRSYSWRDQVRDVWLLEYEGRAGVSHDDFGCLIIATERIQSIKRRKLHSNPIIIMPGTTERPTASGAKVCSFCMKRRHDAVAFHQKPIFRKGTYMHTWVEKRALAHMARVIACRPCLKRLKEGIDEFETAGGEFAGSDELAIKDESAPEAEARTPSD